MNVTYPLARLKTGFAILLDFLLPPRCPATGALVGAQGIFSPEYWAQLTFIHKPFCACCGNPFPHQTTASDALLCGRCMTEPPVYQTARAALKYDDASAALLLKFKYADKTLLANHFAPWMVQAASDLFAHADYVVPVPLHRWRLLKRRYNQAALLAQAIAARTHVKHLPMALKRVRATESQGHKSKNERFDNLRGAFAVDEKTKPLVRGKHIVLIDDVLTSGATMQGCAKTLLDAGAARVDVLTLARVVHTV